MSDQGHTESDVMFDVPTEHGSAAQTGDRAVDEALRLLVNQRRRTILRHLMNHPDGTVAVDDLVDLVLGAETASTAGQQRNTDRIQTDVLCIQVPALRNAGVIEYDEDTEQVHYQAHPRLEALLQSVDRLYQ